MGNWKIESGAYITSFGATSSFNNKNAEGPEKKGLVLSPLPTYIGIAKTYYRLQLLQDMAARKKE